MRNSSFRKRRQLQVDMAEHPRSQPERSGLLGLTNEGSQTPQQTFRGKDGTRMLFPRAFASGKVQRVKSQRRNSFGFCSPES